MDSAQYAELFLTEGREHVTAMNHALLELERAGPGAVGAAVDRPVGEIFRAVHTVKGMSATMGYTAIAELSHELESLLDQVRRRTLEVSPRLMDLLFRSADVLEAAIEEAVRGGGAPEGTAALLDALRTFGRSTGGFAAVPAPGATPAAAPAEPQWSATIPDGPGVGIRIRLAPDTPLRGVRAYLVVETAKRIGAVTAVSPAIDRIQAEEFGDDFAIRLVADDVEGALETLRGAGDVAEVELVEHRRLTDDVSEEAPAAPAAAPAPRDGRRMHQHIRVDLRRLDSLMNLIGELVIARGRLLQLAGEAGDPALTEAVGHASRLIGDLQDEIMQSRMVPVGQVFDRFPRLVRDVSHAVQKDVAFAIEGKDIELDRSMLDVIGDPVMHLLRNAVDHGLEGPAERAAAGKPARGRLVLSAARDRSAVMIRVQDDGRGIDRDRVLRKALERGLVDAGQTSLTDDEVVKLILRPGFSTADQVTGISGRGVGLDVVIARVRGLGGSVDIRSTPGEGTAITMRLPLTLAIQRSLIARVADEVYALPLTHVSETVELVPERLRAVQGDEVFVLREDVLPVLRLRTLVGLPPSDRPDGEQVVVLEAAERRAALIVDDLTTQQEIVVKQFDAVRGGSSLFGGATILGDGAPALILDVSTLL